MTMQNTARPHIPDRGVDRTAESRPGVPMEHAPRPVGAAHWREPERQQSKPSSFKRVGLEQMTPVYGTAVPPRGLSGLIRRLAYTAPDHHARHWVMLLLADRVDIVESALRRAYFLPLALPALAVGGAMLARERRPRGLFRRR